MKCVVPVFGLLSVRRALSFSVFDGVALFVAAFWVASSLVAGVGQADA